MSGLNTLFVPVWVMSCPGYVLSGLCLSGLCPCPGYVCVRVMSVSGLCLCLGYVLSGLCLSGLCPVRVVSVQVMSCPGCVCPGCVVAPFSAGLVWKADFGQLFGNILGLGAYFSKPIFALKW